VRKAQYSYSYGPGNLHSLESLASFLQFCLTHEVRGLALLPGASRWRPHMPKTCSRPFGWMAKHSRRMRGKQNFSSQ
jgi:hypothetical protein